MSTTEVATADAPAPNPTAELNFHINFAKKHPGDVILQADDTHKMCFYFSLPLLSALSSFFHDLPPPTPSDMIDGAARIPFPDTSSPALLITLSAIQAATRSEDFEYPRRSYHGTLRTVSGGLLLLNVLNAALFALRFDLPVIYRPLSDGIPGCEFNSSVRPFLDFFIWAVSGIPSKIAEAGEATLGDDITEIAQPIGAALRLHTPDSWMKLQDLHLRRALAHKRFRAQAVKGVRGGCEACLARGINHTEAVNQAFLKTGSMEEIYALQERFFGMTCEACAMSFRQDYRAKMLWIKHFSTRYNHERDYEDYVKDFSERSL